MAGGYTKRANSASWVAADGLDTGVVIARCEQLYRQAGLPAIFRLVERSETRSMDRALEEGGWRGIEPSLVMLADADCRLAAVAPDADWALLPIAAWARLHAELAGQDPATARRHLELVSRIAGSCFPAVVRQDGETVACGLAVAEGPLLGFFDVLTAARHRGRGHARRLMAGQLAAARRTGVQRLYLQVVATNAPAIGLYRGLGFAEAYRYRYRISPD
jgi:GNAT superfamily N-acetyltransferase